MRSKKDVKKVPTVENEVKKEEAVAKVEAPAPKPAPEPKPVAETKDAVEQKTVETKIDSKPAMKEADVSQPTSDKANVIPENKQ
jgi:hypothetical protein